MSWQDYIDDIQKIYIAYYQRPADPGGLIFWAQKLDEAGGDFYKIIEDFANSEEAKALYGDITPENIEDVIKAIYQAAFNRDPDPQGLEFYKRGFLEGKISPAAIMIQIVNGARNDDATILEKKIEVATEFTKSIDPDLDGKNFVATYAGNDDAEKAREFLKEVTVAEVPSSDQITEYIKEQIADPTDPIVYGTAEGTTGGAEGTIGIAGGGGGNVLFGKTCTLTINKNIIFGTRYNDKFIASDNTLQAEDIINGFGGNDTIILDNQDGNVNAVINLTNVTNVENVKVKDADGGNINLTFQNGRGINTITVDASILDSNHTITINASAVTNNNYFFKITGGAGNDQIIGGAGADTIIGGGGDNLIIGDSGTIDIDEEHFTVTVTGDNGGDDTITVGDGNDYIIGGAGADTITAGNGSYFIIGDSGTIDIDEEHFTATVTGDNGGDDTITAGDGGYYTNYIIGGAGADTITAGNGSYFIIGDSGTIDIDEEHFTATVTVTGDNGGDDTITAGDGGYYINNYIIGGAGADTITAGNGDDIIIGDSGTIDIDEEHFTVTVTGDNGGDDTITVGDGNDYIIGGAGADKIYLGVNDHARDIVFFDNITDGSDRIYDFDVGTDILVFNTNNISLDGSLDICYCASCSDPADAHSYKVIYIVDDVDMWSDVATYINNALSDVDSDSCAHNEQSIILIDNGTDTHIYYFDDDGTSGVSDDELTLLGTIYDLNDCVSMDDHLKLISSIVIPLPGL